MIFKMRWLKLKKIGGTKLQLDLRWYCTSLNFKNYIRKIDRQNLTKYNLVNKKYILNNLNVSNPIKKIYTKKLKYK